MSKAYYPIKYGRNARRTTPLAIYMISGENVTILDIIARLKVTENVARNRLKLARTKLQPDEKLVWAMLER